MRYSLLHRNGTGRLGSCMTLERIFGDTMCMDTLLTANNWQAIEARMELITVHPAQQHRLTLTSRGAQTCVFLCVCVCEREREREREEGGGHSGA